MIPLPIMTKEIEFQWITFEICQILGYEIKFCIFNVILFHILRLLFFFLNFDTKLILNFRNLIHSEWNAKGAGGCMTQTKTRSGPSMPNKLSGPWKPRETPPLIAFRFSFLSLLPPPQKQPLPFPPFPLPPRDRH